MFGWLRRRLAPQAIPEASWQQVVGRHPFLADRPTAERDRLRRLVGYFLAEKEFHGAQGFVITDEVALAIAAQVLVGAGLGAGDVATVRAVLRRCLQWGVAVGAAIGLAVIASSGILGQIFTGDQDVLGVLPLTLIVLGISVPLGGAVFVLDGVLIGAGDARYLAITGFLNLAVFVPLALAVLAWAPSGAAGLAFLMAAFALGYLGARLGTLWPRARSDRWLVLGVASVG